MATSTLDTSSTCTRTPGGRPAPSPARRPKPPRFRLPVDEAASPFLAPSGPGYRGTLGPFPRARALHYPLPPTARARFFCTDTIPAREAQPPSFSAPPPPGTCRRGRETAPFADLLPILVSVPPALRPPIPATVGALVGPIAVHRRAAASRAASQSSPLPAPLAEAATKALPKEHRRQEKELPQRMDPPMPRHARIASPIASPAPPSAPGTPPATMPAASGGRPRALALLAVLEALFPVSRASFLALRAATGLSDPALLGALLSLQGAGLVTDECQSTGSSRLAFTISAAGRAVLAADEPALAILAYPRLRSLPATLATKFAGRPSIRPATPDAQEGRTRDETDGEAAPEATPDEPQEAPYAQGASGRSPGPSRPSGPRGPNRRLEETTDPDLLLWTRGVRSRSEACRRAYREEGHVPARLAALFEADPTLLVRPNAEGGRIR